MNIDIVVPVLHATRFSGGVWCVLQHARELGERGHSVRVVPTHPSAQPDWFPRPWPFELVATAPAMAGSQALASLARAAAAAAAYAVRGERHPSAAAHVADVRSHLGRFARGLARYGSYGQRQGAALDELDRTLRRPVDITLATDTETVWPVRLFGKGRLVHFAQHYEPYFWKERLAGEASLREAELSYRLGMRQLANSPWLQAKLQRLDPEYPVAMCPNAIDHTVFHGTPLRRLAGEPLRIISYGGREAEWKGFTDLCAAMRLLKTRRPDIAVEWDVYGTALLPPDNEIFAYRSLGFLQPKALAQAYRQHHVMLSASWYESFPLFPIEAMACGTAVITTQAGTELFARDGDTALIATPRHVDTIAAAVERLADDEDLRSRLATQGRAGSLKFDWKAAGEAMEKALLAICSHAPAPKTDIDAV